MTQRQSSQSIARMGSRLSMMLGSLFVVAVGPVAAHAAQASNQQTGFCDIPFVGSLVNTGFTIFIGGALALGLLTWVATSFTESLPLPQDTKKQIKHQRNSGLASSLRAVFVPALIITFLDAASIGLPSCVNVFPF